jgi:outer membrane protein assembly factor BamB
MTTRILIGLGVVVLIACGVLFAIRWFRPPSPHDRPADDDSSISAPLNGIPDAGDNWPRFRGPTGQGIAANTKLPLEWSETKNLLWKRELPGPGSSSPIVWGERVFVTCFSGHENSPSELKRHLVCVNRADGKIIWTRDVPAAQPEDPYTGYLKEHGYATNTPATDGERVYAFFGKSGVFAFDFKGNQLWHAEVGQQSSNRRWGSAASVVLYGELVIVNASEEGRAVFAFDRKTGKQKWKAHAESSELSFSTPILTRWKDQAELVMAVPGQVWGLNPATGGTRWHVNVGLDGNLSPSPVEHDGVVYLTGGFHPTRTVAVSVKAARGEADGPAVLWSLDRGSYVPSPVFADGHLFLVTDEGQARCLNPADGEQLGQKRLPIKGSGKTIYASPVLADGKLYCVTRRGGTMVLSATPELELLTTNRFADDDSDFNASPAVSKGQIFLRSGKYLYCVGE